jgi:hypothetical protein
MTKLAEIAAAMTAVVDTTNGPARHTLSRGLTITYLRRANTRPATRQLSLTRALVAPSDEEERICREAFHVPPDASRSQLMINGCGVIRLIWLESPPVQAALPDIGPETGKDTYYAAA